MSRRRTPPLTVLEHIRLGDRLAELQKEIVSIGYLLQERLPAVHRRWVRGTNPLIDCKLALENDLIKALQREGLDDGKTIPPVYLGRRIDP